MKKIIALFAMGLFCFGAAYAVPAKRTAYEKKQGDGSVITVVKTGDEKGHCYKTTDGKAVEQAADGNFYYLTSEGLTQVMAHNLSDRTAAEKTFVEQQGTAIEGVAVVNAKINSSKRTAPSKVKFKSQVPNVGTPKIPIILVQYKDIKFKDADPKAVFDAQMSTSKESVKAYFKDQSFDKFDPEFDVLGPVTLSNNRVYYGGNDSYGEDLRPGEMIKEACDLLSTTTNFADYDNDKDGYVDVVYVIYAGVGEASSDVANSVWPHQWQLGEAIGSAVTYGTVKVDKYACGNELYGSQIDGIGTFCHEFSHCLGLPDFYDTQSQTNYGMDEWSLMDYGSYNNDGKTPCGYTAYEREFMKWMTIETISDKGNYTLATLPNGGKAYRVQNAASANEYYILENRQQTGWDRYMSGHGMMVTHVDYNASTWANNTVNNTASHQRMTIIPADNKLTHATNGGDLYPNNGANTELTDDSTPAAKVFTGSYMSQPISNIAENDGVVTFTFNFVAEKPVAGDATTVTSNSFTANWSAVEGAKTYTLKVKKTKPGESTLLFAETFAKCTAVGTKDVGTSIDTYMDNSGWEGQNIYTEIGGMRLGSSKNIGYILSPYFDADGTISLIVKAKSYNADGTIELGVGVAVDDSDEVLDGCTVELTGTESTQCIVLENAEAQSYVQLQSMANKKRVVLTGLKLYTGDMSASYPSSAVKRINAKKAASKVAKNSKAQVAAEETIIENITGTSYEVKDLDPEYTYSYQVKAVYEDGTESGYSNSVKVELETTGVEDNLAEKASVRVDGNKLYIDADAQGHVYSITGVEMPAAAHNEFSLTTGIYVVKVGAKTVKVIVK